MLGQRLVCACPATVMTKHDCESLGVGDNTGESVAEPTEQQQGGGEMIENADAPDNPDGYLAEEGGAGAEGANGSEALPAKV